MAVNAAAADAAAGLLLLLRTADEAAAGRLAIDTEEPWGVCAAATGVTAAVDTPEGPLCW
jgi:hypothetical protein